MLVDLFLATADRDPTAPALGFGDAALTWAQWRAEAGAVAAALHARGIGPGATVGLALGAGPDFAIACIGALWAGAEVALFDPLGPALPPGLDLLIARAPVAGAASMTMDEACAAIAPAAPGRGGDAPALMQFSSGSTGAPKPVRRSHGACMAEIGRLGAAAGIGPGDAIFCPLPLFHSHGFFNGFWAAIAAGARLELMDRPQPFALQARRAAAVIRAKRCTIIVGTPFHFDALARLPEMHGPRLAISAGHALPRDVHDAFLARHGVPIRQLWGCTEGGALTLDLGDPPDPETVGAPLPGVEITVLDDAGRPAPAGVAGEIRVRSASLPDALNAGAGFSSGDMGVIGPDGRLRVLGRRDAMMLVAGDKVFPAQIEAALLSHPAVSEAVVAGRPDGRGGQAITAWVAVRAPTPEADLHAHCRAHLPRARRPARIVVTDRLPRTATGKVALAQLV